MTMKIRKPFAAAFVILVLLSGSAGLSPIKPYQPFEHSDKGLHFITFFALTVCFYWILETNRRRTLQITLIVVTLVLASGSEVAQGLLPNGREFDPWDILANVIGSLAGLGLCTWYHKRMLERKRQAKYDAVPGEDEELDLELGEGVGPQESGVTSTSQEQNATVSEELDNWDENAEDWDDDEDEASKPVEDGPKTSEHDVANGLAESKKRND